MLLANILKNKFSKRKMELNALEEKCLNWKDEFDKDFKVCNFRDHKCSDNREERCQEKYTYLKYYQIYLNLNFRKNARLHHMEITA